MSDYTIVDLNNLVLRHVNMISCDCKHLAHVGTYVNGNKFVYNPEIHNIKECMTATDGSINCGYYYQAREGSCNLVINPDIDCLHFYDNNNYLCKKQ